jgi:hypothetical protein
MVDVGKIIEYESGEMDGDAVVAFFQEMIDDGSVWSLQGHYGRTATALIEAGLCHKKGG